MCYYNGIRVTRGEYIRLKNIEKELKGLQLNRPVQSGFDYRDWPIIKPIAGGKDFEIEMAHWEYIPGYIRNEQQLQESRKFYAWLNAKSENLFVNDKGRVSIYKDGATHGRCLVLSSGFFEWRHMPKLGKKGQTLKATEKFPYHITLNDDQEYFFMAGVLRNWENQDRHQSADTFAIVTTEANELMAQIHNSKKRMPTILTEDLAFEWIQESLSEQRIKEIAKFQYPSDKMKAWPVAKDFLKQPDPTLEFHYENLPVLQ